MLVNVGRTHRTALSGDAVASRRSAKRRFSRFSMGETTNRHSVFRAVTSSRRLHMRPSSVFGPPRHLPTLDARSGKLDAAAADFLITTARTTGDMLTATNRCSSAYNGLTPFAAKLYHDPWLHREHSSARKRDMGRQLWRSRMGSVRQRKSGSTAEPVDAPDTQLTQCSSRLGGLAVQERPYGSCFRSDFDEAPGQRSLRSDARRLEIDEGRFASCPPLPVTSGDEHHSCKPPLPGRRRNITTIGSKDTDQGIRKLSFSSCPGGHVVTSRPPGSTAASSLERMASWGNHHTTIPHVTAKCNGTTSKKASTHHLSSSKESFSIQRHVDLAPKYTRAARLHAGKDSKRARTIHLSDFSDFDSRARMLSARMDITAAVEGAVSTTEVKSITGLPQTSMAFPQVRVAGPPALGKVTFDQSTCRSQGNPGARGSSTLTAFPSTGVNFIKNYGGGPTTPSEPITAVAVVTATVATTAATSAAGRKPTPSLATPSPTISSNSAPAVVTSASAEEAKFRRCVPSLKPSSFVALPMVQPNGLDSVTADPEGSGSSFLACQQLVGYSHECTSAALAVQNEPKLKSQGDAAQSAMRNLTVTTVAVEASTEQFSDKICENSHQLPVSSGGAAPAVQRLFVTSEEKLSQPFKQGKRFCVDAIPRPYRSRPRRGHPRGPCWIAKRTATSAGSFFESFDRAITSRSSSGVQGTVAAADGDESHSRGLLAPTLLRALQGSSFRDRVVPQATAFDCGPAVSIGKESLCRRPEQLQRGTNRRSGSRNAATSERTDAMDVDDCHSEGCYTVKYTIKAASLEIPGLGDAEAYELSLRTHPSTLPCRREVNSRRGTSRVACHLVNAGSDIVPMVATSPRVATSEQRHNSNAAASSTCVSSVTTQSNKNQVEDFASSNGLEMPPDLQWGYLEALAQDISEEENRPVLPETTCGLRTPSGSLWQYSHLRLAPKPHEVEESWLLRGGSKSALAAEFDAEFSHHQSPPKPPQSTKQDSCSARHIAGALRCCNTMTGNSATSINRSLWRSSGGSSSVPRKVSQWNPTPQLSAGVVLERCNCIHRRFPNLVTTVTGECPKCFRVVLPPQQLTQQARKIVQRARSSISKSRSHYGTEGLDPLSVQKRNLLLDGLRICAVATASASIRGEKNRHRSSKSRSSTAKSNQDRGFIVRFRCGLIALGIFDGHGSYGHVVSSVACNAFESLLQGTFNHNGSPIHGAHHVVESPVVLQAWLTAAFHNVDVAVLNILNPLDLEHSGSTGTVALITGTYVLIGFIGDSKGLAYTLNRGSTIGMVETPEHQPIAPAELRRIKRFRGSVSQCYFSGLNKTISRLLPSGVAVSRSFGDTFARQFGLIAKPEFVSLQFDAPHCKCPRSGEIDDDLRRTAVVVLATDGLWDTMNGGDVMTVLKQYPTSHASLQNDLQDLAFTAWENRLHIEGRADDTTILAAALSLKDT